MQYTKTEDTITEHLLDMLLQASRGQWNISDHFDAYQQDLRDLGKHGLANAFAAIKHHVVSMESPIIEIHERTKKHDAINAIDNHNVSSAKVNVEALREPSDIIRLIEQDIDQLMDHIKFLKKIDGIYKNICDQALDYVAEAKRVLPDQ